jgi:uncharacterized protein
MEHRRPPTAPLPPLAEADIARLQALLDALPAPLQPLDTSMLDGYLCGVLLQPQPVAEAAWLPHALDARDDVPHPLPATFDAAPLLALLRRRHAELGLAIERREWFDPWVFELEDDADEGGSEVEAVYPWVAGFAIAMSRFPRLMAIDDPALLEPLALVFRHVDADDLEDADALLAEIETLEPPADLAEAVEELVRAMLLLADVSRPQKKAPSPRRSGPPRPPKRRTPRR